MIKVKPAEPWRSECQSCSAPSPDGLKVVSLTRRLDARSAESKSFALCRACRRILRGLLMEE